MYNIVHSRRGQSTYILIIYGHIERDTSDSTTIRETNKKLSYCNISILEIIRLIFGDVSNRSQQRIEYSVDMCCILTQVRIRSNNTLINIKNKLLITYK